MNNNKQMKLILERWDKFVLQEENKFAFKKLPLPEAPINTVGQLRIYFAQNASDTTKDSVYKNVQEFASNNKTALSIGLSAVAAGAAGLLGLAPVGGALAGAALTYVQEMVNSAVIEGMVDTLGVQLLAIPDADRGRWGEIATLFDINDVVFNFLTKAYGGKIPDEVVKASEQLKEIVLQKIDISQPLSGRERISQVFGGVETIQQRVDDLLKISHRVKIEPV